MTEEIIATWENNQKLTAQEYQASTMLVQGGLLSKEVLGKIKHIQQKLQQEAGKKY